MAKTRANLITDLRNELTIDPNAKIWTNTELIGYLDSAYLQIQQDGNFRWSENEGGTDTTTTTAGTQEYALPSDLGKIDMTSIIKSLSKSGIAVKEGSLSESDNSPANFNINLLFL